MIVWLKDVKAAVDCFKNVKTLEDAIDIVSKRDASSMMSAVYYTERGSIRIVRNGKQELTNKSNRVTEMQKKGPKL